MRQRQKCLRLGHDYREFAEARLPVIFCRRWFCDAAMVPAWVWREAPEMASLLEAECRRAAGGDQWRMRG